MGYVIVPWTVFFFGGAFFRSLNFGPIFEGIKLDANKCRGQFEGFPLITVHCLGW